MIDDTRGNEASSGSFGFSSKIDEILQHQMYRTKAAQWARNLRFLTFAGDESSTDPKTQERFEPLPGLHRDQCSRCELSVRPPAEHKYATHTRTEFSKNAYEKQVNEHNNPCVHVESRSCEECRHIPLFPSHGKTTKFRIRRLKPKDTRLSELGMCSHFVAVSYCWSSLSSRNSGEPNASSEQYQVLEEDMKTKRPIRAPKDTIDRAVSFAAQNGFRMIWIDQECIEQEDKQEKELGIQAMDYVYVNAQISIGLFQVTLEQHHLGPLLLFFESLEPPRIGSKLRRRGPRALRKCRLLKIEPLAEALSMVAMDRWNTRAWILQEAFASAGKMVLLLPRAKGVAIKGWSLVCHDLSLTEIGIRLEDLQRCVMESAALLMPKPGRTIAVKLPKWGETLQRLAWFLPEQGGYHIPQAWLVTTKARPTCNAAVALSFLKHRDNDRVADRLAIIANLCDYSLRLNTWELDESQSRLSVCVLALTIANGDFSLLWPESYRIPRAMHITQDRCEQDFTWVPPHVDQFRYIETTYADPEGVTPGPTATIGFSVTNKGFSLLGYLWKVDRFVELYSIRDKYRESWSRLCRSNRKLEEESLQAMGPSGVSHGMIRASTQIIFEVIELLQSESQTDIADAIWQSLSDINGGKSRCPESVSDFSEQLTVEKRKGMFWLERSQDGLFQQKWLIDRIMLQGGFWVGRLVRRSTDFEYSDRVSTEDDEKVTDSVNGLVDCAPQEQMLEEKLRSHGPESVKLSRVLSEAVSIARESAQHYPLDSIDRSSVSAILFYWNKRINEAPQKSENVPQHEMIKSFSDYQLYLSVMTRLLKKAGMELDDELLRVDDPSSRNVSVGTLLAMVAEGSTTATDPDGRGSPAYLRRQCALFDIEGDISGQVLVLTPFQKRLETIPRPEHRSMSVSWVVQPVSNVEGSGDKEETDFLRMRETFKTSGMVRGMWKLMVQPMNRYVLV